MNSATRRTDRSGNLERSGCTPDAEMATEVRQPLATIGRYRVVRGLGAGGMGEVYVAEDEALGRLVAVKVIASRFAEDSTWMLRLRREAQAVARLDHPNIVTIHDFGTDGNRPFFVTEYIRGTTLREIIRRGASSRQQVIELALPIAEALTAAHEAGIVHRDIKPENVLVDEHGHVKVIDFGVSKLLGTDATPVAVGEPGTEPSSGVIGTLNYMAPEQIRGEAVSGSADVFALGIVVYELIAGYRPFVEATAQETMGSILTRDPAPLAGDPLLARLVGRMLSKEPDARPAAAEVVRELHALGAGHGPDATGATNAVPARSAPTNLPSDATPLVGREHDLSSITSLLRHADVRLVTLTGAGGSGKTRLAIAAARQLLDRFPDGVWFVPLDAIRDPGHVAAAVADALGVAPLSLAERLRHERALLVLDNFEQVTDAAGDVLTLLAATESLKVLVTSQAPLQVRAEHEYALEPLGVPADDLPQTVAANEAVRMFVDRARSVRRDFELNVENAPTIAQICRVLDGLPLAIELAAVRVRLLSPATILAGLRDPLAFLTDGPRDLPARQRTLRAAVEWSFALLSQDEKALLTGLAVFEGGWTIDACTDVVREDAEGLLAALIEKSLIRRLPGPGAERFGMLDAIRRVAAERLAASADRADLAERHLRWFAALAETARTHLLGAEQPWWIARLSAEQGNLRAALRHASSSGDAEAGLGVAIGIWKFWELRGWYREGREWLTAMLSIADHVSPTLRWQACYARGVLADAQGDYDAAHASFAEQLTICRQSGDRGAIASAINNLAIVALRLGNADEAAAHHEEALSIQRELGHTLAAALSLQNLGHVERRRGALSAARRRYHESLELFRSLNDRRGVAISLTCLADIDRDEDRLDEAVAAYEEALQIFMELTDHWQVAQCMADYAEACLRLEKLDEAKELLAESVVIHRELGDLKRGADVLDRLALLAVKRNHPECGLQLRAASLAIKRRLGIASPTSPDLEAAMAAARSAAGERADEAWRRGSEMSFDDAVELAQ